MRRWSQVRKCQAEGLGTRRRPSAEAQHPEGHGALSRGVVPGRPRPGMPSGGAGDRGQSPTARRPNADLSPGERQLHGPEALGQPATDRHRPGPPLPACRQMGREVSPRDRETARLSAGCRWLPERRGAARWVVLQDQVVGRASSPLSRIRPTARGDLSPRAAHKVGEV